MSWNFNPYLLTLCGTLALTYCLGLAGWVYGWCWIWRRDDKFDREWNYDESARVVARAAVRAVALALGAAWPIILVGGGLTLLALWSWHAVARRRRRGRAAGDTR